MRYRSILAAACVAVLFGSLPAHAANSPYEQLLLDLPSAQGALEASARLNQESHYAGTPGDEHIAMWMRDRLAADGFDATLEPFFAEIPQSPTKIILSLMERPHRVDFDLREAPIAGDPDGTRKNAGVLPFDAWSGSGDVTATLVDTAHGTRADYAVLDRAGISVSHRIVLIAYGAEFRGTLARRAERHGAVGVIFWSDPSDRDGSDHGPAYPNGPYRPLGSVQRGSLGLPRLRIPVLPVSASVGLRLRASMHDRVSNVPVRLRVDAGYKWQTIWNTIGVLRGTDPTHYIILGAHRDAWVYGVTDDGSGISTLLETAHALGYLYRSGWRPRYSIVVAGWDGEELGELGSLQYVREHFASLLSGCLAYINEDEDATGQRFVASAAAALGASVVRASNAIADPALPTQRLYDRWNAQSGGVDVRSPGGGSDFEPFLYEAGIPTIETGFVGPFGVYHSAFDDLRYATTQADPGFVNHRAIAQLIGVLAYRLTAGPLHYRFMPYVAPMRAALAAYARRGASASDLASVDAALSRFASVALAVDTHGAAGGREINAVQALDRLYYGRERYRPVAFPDLAKGLASGTHPAIAAAAARTANALDAIVAELRPAIR
ncbi:MAG: M28 family peptidase [Vulcanimicrobiaceae bacterium]